MAWLKELREEQALLEHVIELAKEIKVVTPEGTVTDLTLDTTSHKERLVKVREKIAVELEKQRESREIDRDWYLNH